MYVSKRQLGTGYLVTTGVILAAVLLAQTLRGEAIPAVWAVAFTVPAVVLVSALYWLRELGLTSEQVWTASKGSAVGLAVGTALFLGVELFASPATVTSRASALYGTTLATMAVAGALGGVVLGLRTETSELKRQNTVLHRVLRHNLRNDMTVVLCLLDDLERSVDGDEAETVEQAKSKIRSFVRLTDKVREANVHRADGVDPRRPRDVAGLVETRVAELDDTATAEVETDVPDRAMAHVGDSFGLVVENVVESAATSDQPSPDLTIRVRTDRRTVRLEVDDYGQTLPDADLSAVASGGETDLDHGRGVELWLVDWLVAANDGDLRFEVGEDLCRVVVEVPRARPDWLR